MAFSPVDSDTRPSQDRGGLRRDPLEQPAVDTGHGAGAGRAAAVEHGQQLPAGGVPVAGPFGLELDQPDELGRAGRVQVDVELGQILGGQVDPPVLMVLADVAQDVGQLQGYAERVSQAGGLALVVAGAEDAQRQPADRACHAAAVVVQILERLVVSAADVGHAPVDELAERLHRDREVALGVGQREQHRVVEVGPVEVEDGLAGGLQVGDLLLGRQGPVADVVDAPGERVDDGEPAPLGVAAAA